MREALAFVAVLVGVSAAAAEPVPVRGVDLLIDTQKYAGQVVALDRCRLNQAADSGAACSFVHRGATIGMVHIRGRDLNRADLRRAIEDCSSVDVPSTCDVLVSGTVVYQPPLGPAIDHPKVTWLN